MTGFLIALTVVTGGVFAGLLREWQLVDERQAHVTRVAEINAFRAALDDVKAALDDVKGAFAVLGATSIRFRKAVATARMEMWAWERVDAQVAIPDTSTILRDVTGS